MIFSLLCTDTRLSQTTVQYWCSVSKAKHDQVFTAAFITTTGLWIHLEGRKYGPLAFKSTLRFIFLIILTDNGTLSPSTTSTSNGQSLSSAFKIVPQKTDLPSSTTGKILDLNKSIKWDENVDCKSISCNENRISLCAHSHRGNYLACSLFYPVLPCFGFIFTFTEIIKVQNI